MYRPLLGSERIMDSAILRSRVLPLLGAFPNRIPLDAVIGRTFDEGDHLRVRVTFMTEPGERVPSWLLIPHGAAPTGGWPGLLAIHQHANQYDLGKAEPAG